MAMERFPQIFEGIDDLELGQVYSLMQKALDYKIKYLNPLSLSKPSSHFIHSTISTIFLENSTRTQSSFIKAAQNLGMSYLPFDAQRSSLAKGEDLQETFLTLESLGVNLIVYRTNISGELKALPHNFPIPIINAGDGVNEHPTQALTDLFTILEEGHMPNSTTISIIGDVKHSRVANSLIKLLSRLNFKIIIVTPKNLKPSFPLSKNIIETEDLDEAIYSSDILYTLRIQKERHSSIHKNKRPISEYHQKFGINLKKLQSFNKKISVYHPGPINLGVELATDVVKSSYYKGYQQVQNGVFVRMALIKSMVKKQLTHKQYQWEKQYENFETSRFFTL